jgi:hypothetical protein
VPHDRVVATVQTPTSSIALPTQPPATSAGPVMTAQLRFILFAPMSQGMLDALPAYFAAATGADVYRFTAAVAVDEYTVTMQVVDRVRAARRLQHSRVAAADDYAASPTAAVRWPSPPAGLSLPAVVPGAPASDGGAARSERELRQRGDDDLSTATVVNQLYLQLHNASSWLMSQPYMNNVERYGR